MAENVVSVYLSWFTSDTTFPFFIQYGEHYTDCFIHLHYDFDELVIVLDGSAVHIVNNEEYPVKKGDVFVVSNDTIHGYRGAKNFRICNIMYRHNEMFISLPDIAASAGYQALFVLEPSITKEQGFRNKLKLNNDNYKAVKFILDDMLNEYGKKSDCWKTMLIAQFVRLATMLSRLYTFDDGESEQDIINIAKAVSYIESHFNENILIDNLAKLSHYSKRHFIRIFNKKYNCSPKEYIIKLRINHACALLNSSDMTISEIAWKCGFYDINYFSRLFKKKIGISPSEYRGKFLK